MQSATTHVSAEAAILELQESWQAAVRDKDIEAITAHYAPGIVAFDAISQLQFKGLEAYRKHWEACMAMCQGPMTFELHEVAITADEHAAFCHALVNCGGTNDKGEQESGWMRMTAGYRRIDGRWLVVHEHFSAPFDMASGKAMFDLEP
ncbi:YybH family protein [Litchfieldella rifensis]|uniref:YybH family protein n=1 Tax=Litchfieldella rifensis TaxID=762643 RepID=A0ABV7LVD9_9GAMM